MTLSPDKKGGLLGKLGKLRGRGAAELRVRGAQALSARAERAGLSAQTRVPTDRAFFRLLDPDHFDRAPLSADALLAHFRARRTPRFFAAFDDREATRAQLRRRFSDAHASLSARAERVKSGRFDLLGASDLDFGSPIDWHAEPTSEVRAPLAHWSAIDFLDPRVAGDKKFIWELSRLQHFFALGRAYWRTGDESLAETFAAHADAWMDANPPKRGVNWASSLEVAFRAITWAWSLHFFRDARALTPPLYLRLLKFIHLHARHVETYLSTYFSPNTHLTGEALGLYYVGTAFPQFKRAAHWRALGSRILVEQLERHVLPDGVYVERTTYYHRYTADFYTHFLLLARANEGLDPVPDDARRRAEEKLIALCDHLLYITRPDGTTPYFGDDDGGRLAPLDDSAKNDFRATLAVAATLLARADYKHVAGGASESLLWLTGAEGLRAYDALAAQEPAETSRAFPVGGYYAMRDGWTPQSNFMLIDGGAHGARQLSYGHAHADALSFDLSAEGRPLIVDPGTYTYTGSPVWRDHFRSSRAHNTLAVDGESSSVPASAFRWRHVADARATAWRTHARFDYFAGEHDGYRRLDGHESYERAIVFLKGDYWIVRDRVRASGTHRYELNFQLAPGVEARVEEGAGSQMAHATVNGETALTLFTFSHGGEWSAEEDWVSSAYGERTPAAACRYTSEGKGAQEFVTFALSARAACDARVVRTNAVGGNGYELQRADGSDVLLTNYRSSVVGDRLVSDFEWTWARFDGDGALAELLLINGRNCLLDGQAIIEAGATVAYVHARRDGAELIVETDDSLRRVALNDSRALVT